jgi:hypothetical protein
VNPGKMLSVPLVQPCAFPDCSSLTMGEFCIEHEVLLDEPVLTCEPLRSEEVSEPALDPVP